MGASALWWDGQSHDHWWDRSAYEGIYKSVKLIENPEISLDT